MSILSGLLYGWFSEIYGRWVWSIRTPIRGWQPQGLDPFGSSLRGPRPRRRCGIGAPRARARVSPPKRLTSPSSPRQGCPPRPRRRLLPGARPHFQGARVRDLPRAGPPQSRPGGVLLAGVPVTSSPPPAGSPLSRSLFLNLHPQPAPHVAEVCSTPGERLQQGFGCSHLLPG